MLRKYNTSICYQPAAIYILMIIAFFACGQKKPAQNSPPGYNLDRPYTIKLPSELYEISGIAYYRKDNSLFAESDDKGALFKIFLDNPKDIRKWRFRHKRNYEDIVLHDSAFYILNDNGDIAVVRFVKDSLVLDQYDFPYEGKNEFETIYYDERRQKIILMCKDCEVDNNNTVSTFAFDPQQFSFSSSATIDSRSIVEQISPKSGKFKPSAAAVNPVTGELFILSSVNKMLVVCDSTGRVKEIYNLNTTHFNHPEGIAFTPDGNLFISNEGDKIRPASILYFKKQDK